MRARVGATLPPEGLGDRISLEKAWHGVHFLLCGAGEPTDDLLSHAVMGGTEIGEDGGYGPARYLEPEEVARTAAALAGVTADDLRARYDAAAMEEAHIYPGGWGDPENLEWVLEAFQELAAFYQGVASRGNALVLYLT